MTETTTPFAPDPGASSAPTTHESKRCSPPLGAARLICSATAVFGVLSFLVSISERLSSLTPDFDGSPLDDAYMFLRYSKHWWSGNGFSWNVADGPAYGITSTLHLLCVTLARGLTAWSDKALLLGLSCLNGFLAVSVLAALGFVCFSGLRRSLFPLLVMPVFFFSNLLGFHCMTGMETTLGLLTNALFCLSTVLRVS